MATLLEPDRTASAAPADNGTSERDRPPSVWSRRAGDWVLAMLVAIITWTDINRLATPWIDDSWRYSLTAARDNGVDFGRDLAFTYGPLVFLDGGPTYTIATGAAAFVMRFALATATALLVIRVVKDVDRSRWKQVAAAWIVVAVIVPPDRYGEVAVIVACGWIARSLIVEGYITNSARLAVAAGAGVWMAVKPSAAVVLVGVACIAALPRPRRAAEGQASTDDPATPSGAAGRVAATLAAAVAAMTVTWILAGQPVDSLPGFLQGWLEVSGGFASGMGHGRGVAFAAEAALAIMAISIAIVSLVRLRRHPTASTWALFLMIGALLFWGRQIAMARPDPPHMKDLGVLVVVLTLALWPILGRRGRVLLMGLSLPLVVLFSTIPVPAVVETVPVVGSVGSFASEVKDLVEGEFIEGFRSELADHYDLSDSIIDGVDGRPVHISTQSTNLAFAYPELGFWVLPTVQHYVSYSDELERRNVDALLGPDGPELVIHEPATYIDDHHPAWESPLLINTLWCSFTPVDHDDRWHLLTSTDSTCHPATPLAEPVPVTSRVTIPSEARACPGLVTFRIFGAEHVGLDRLALLAFRQPSPFVTTQRERWPLIPGTASQPHTIAAPSEDRRWLGQEVPTPAQLDLELTIEDLAGYVGPSETPTIQFECWTKGPRG